MSRKEKQIKVDRISVSVPADKLDEIERAAELSGMNRSEFMTRGALTLAREVLAVEERARRKMNDDA